MNHQTFVDYFEEEKRLVLNEGLITTYPASVFEHALKNKFKNEIQSVIPIFNFLGFKTKFEVHVEDVSKLNDIKDFVDSCGYHIGAYQENPPTIHIEPKYPLKVFKKDLPEKAYHITRNEHLESILKNGLTPKNSKTFFGHPGNRIYLFVTNDLQDVLTLKNLLKKTFSARERNVGLTVLEVSLWSEVYYLDPNLEPKDISETSFGVFTLRNIASQLIKPLLNLSDNNGKTTKSIPDFKFQQSLKK